MFSEKFRPVKMIALGGVVLVLCFYAAEAGPKVDPSPTLILAGDQGFPITIDTQYTEVVAINPATASLVLRVEGHEFTARFSELPVVKVGQNISLSGTVIDRDIVDVTIWHLHPGRMLKYYFSLPAIIWVIYLLFKKYQFNWKKFEFFEKDRSLSK